MEVVDPLGSVSVVSEVSVIEASVVGSSVTPAVGSDVPSSLVGATVVVPPGHEMAFDEHLILHYRASAATH